MQNQITVFGLFLFLLAGACPGRAQFLPPPQGPLGSFIVGAGESVRGILNGLRPPGFPPLPSPVHGFGGPLSGYGRTPPAYMGPWAPSCPTAFRPSGELPVSPISPTDFVSDDGDMDEFRDDPDFHWMNEDSSESRKAKTVSRDREMYWDPFADIDSDTWLITNGSEN